MRVALVHDLLTQDGGAERALMAMAEVFPDAPIYTLVYDKKRMGKFFADKDIRTSFLQNLPGGIRYYQLFLRFMPWAIESHDLNEYEVVISSASSFAKGVITGHDTVHVCYCHTPARYLWSDTHQYVRELPYLRSVQSVVPALLTRLRQWDRLSAERPDIMLANSETVRRRIKKYYQREAEVLHPPVDVDRFSPTVKRENFFVAGGRLVPYKQFAIVVEAFNRLQMPLVIFGDGPERKRLEAMAKQNITFLGYVPDSALAKLLAEAKAYIHPQFEDFGITAVEAMASGTPVIAYHKGGATETIIKEETGIFFDEQSWPSLAAAVLRFSPDSFSTDKLLKRAQIFSTERFKQKLERVIHQARANH